MQISIPSLADLFFKVLSCAAAHSACGMLRTLMLLSSRDRVLTVLQIQPWGAKSTWHQRVPSSRTCPFGSSNGRAI